MSRALTDAAVRRWLDAPGDSPARLLLRGGTVLSMDAATGDYVRGDVLVVGERIEAVGADLSGAADAPGTLIIDATGTIVLPGFQDTHRHCWQTQFRRYLAGVDLGEYVDSMHATIGPRCAPEDIYAGNLLAALGALDSGVTTLLDFSHNCRSVEHADAGIQAHADAGIRAVFAYGPPLFGDWAGQWPADLSRVAGALPGGGLVTLRMAVLADGEIGDPAVSLTADNLAVARTLGLPIIADAAIGASTATNVEKLGARGLLGPDVTLIHGTQLTDAAWRVIADTGTRVSLCPTSDPQVGLADGVPPIQRVLDLGVVAGLSVDVECCLSTSMFAQMQAVYTIQRMLAFGGAASGDEQAPSPMSVRQVLGLATTGGAAVNGLSNVAGSLRPGAAADIVLIDADDINTLPLNNAAATVVLGAETRNVDTVLVAGRIRKFRGALVSSDVARARRLAIESRDRLLAATGLSLDVLA